MQQTSTKGFKNRHDWVGNLIHWELRNKMKFHLTDQQYMQKPECVLENEIIWEFDIKQITESMPDDQS